MENITNERQDLEKLVEDIPFSNVDSGVGGGGGGTNTPFILYITVELTKAKDDIL